MTPSSGPPEPDRESAATPFDEAPVNAEVLDDEASTHPGDEARTQPGGGASSEPGEGASAEFGPERQEHTDEVVAETSAELELAPESSAGDDDVHFGVAAKALGVSRKTIERMVKRQQLQRGPSGAPATVSKRSLVRTLGLHREDVTQVMSINEVEPARRDHQDQPAVWATVAPGDMGDLRRLLEPLVDELVETRSRAEVLQGQIDSVTEHEHRRDELLLALATGSWAQRRKARKFAMRHLVRRNRLPGPPS